MCLSDYPRTYQGRMMSSKADEYVVASTEGSVRVFFDGNPIDSSGSIDYLLILVNRIYQVKPTAIMIVWSVGEREYTLLFEYGQLSTETKGIEVSAEVTTEATNLIVTENGRQVSQQLEGFIDVAFWGLMKFVPSAFARVLS